MRAEPLIAGALIGVVACGHPARPRPATCPAGDVLVESQADVAALAGCRRLAGALAIRTGVALDLGPLARLEEVRGDLVVGPTLALGGVDGFGGLRAVGGTLRVASNGEATGAWFPALERAGAVEVVGNTALAELFVPRLGAVDRDVVIRGNPALELVDAGSLRRARRLSIEDDRALAVLRVPAAVGAEVHVARTALDPAAIDALTAKVP
jgi:hypothetical protein